MGRNVLIYTIIFPLHWIRMVLLKTFVLGNSQQGLHAKLSKSSLTGIIGTP